MESFRLAARMGADSVETDLQLSADGVLVLIHDTELSRTTDVAFHPEFAERRTRRMVGQMLVQGWFVDDFTLAELRTLNEPTTRIPTLDELLLLVAAESRRARRRLGLHLEIKHPAYFAGRGRPITGVVLETLRDHGLDRPDAGVWLQCFDEQFLRALSPLTALPLVQLLEPGQRFDCTQIAGYADAIGPERSLVLASDRFDTGLVAQAHRSGLAVFTFTLRGDVAQAQRFLSAGVDGIFSDDASIALSARQGVVVA